MAESEVARLPGGWYEMTFMREKPYCFTTQAERNADSALQELKT